ncbi:MAG: tetratricopeptide repeat protein [Candidatus Acidiferrum sp.]|jgi:tetratricopeptide (TPR) repeat protein
MTSFEQSGMRQRNVIYLALALMLLALVLGVAVPRAAAQADGVITGTILTVDGKPWPDLSMQSVSDQGAKLETKTDKDGNYAFRNLKSGVYHVYAVLPAPNKPYDVQCRVQGGTPTRVDLNFKEIIAQQGAASQEAVKKQAEEKQAVETMKAHFAAGSALLDQEHQAKADLAKAPGDQRETAKQKVVDLSNQAAAEFQAAQKAGGEKDPNVALFWAKLGDAYDTAGRNDEAAQAYQAAIAAKPDIPGYYNNLGNVLARQGKIDEAKTAYEKSASLDPPGAASAWRNFGISLYNANRLGDAVEPLQKSLALDPSSAQTWYLLGASLVYKMTTKRVGNKDEVVLAPGTVEAYQKALELDPNGPWGAQAKEGLAQLQAIAPGIDISVSNKKKKS